LLSKSFAIQRIETMSATGMIDQFEDGEVGSGTFLVGFGRMVRCARPRLLLES